MTQIIVSFLYKLHCPYLHLILQYIEMTCIFVDTTSLFDGNVVTDNINIGGIMFFIIIDC